MTSDGGGKEKEVFEAVKALIEEYNRDYKDRKDKNEISEADVRAVFIDRLFSILGWNISDPDEYTRERYVRGAGFADIALILEGKPVAFVEAKRFGAIPYVDREEKDWIEEERQVLNYAASPERKIKWAILTNFEKTRVFNALNGKLVLFFEAPFEYLDKFKHLLLLSKESFETGKIDHFEEHEERPDIDMKFLEKLNSWRLALANNIYMLNKDNPVLQRDGEFSLEKLKSAVQRLLDRLIIIRYAEDKLILDNPDQLMAIKRMWETNRSYVSLYDVINKYFEGFDRIHDSKIFETGHICEKIEIEDDVLAEIIDILYSINFRKFDFDILGNTYETYLGNTLSFNERGEIVLKPVQEKRKKSGIYYTPPYIVDFIVKNTLGELLKGKSVEEVRKIKVLDPACGSGSFLIKAYSYIAEFYKKENEKIRKKREEIAEKIRKSGNGVMDYAALEHLREYKNYEKEILQNNIYGVDLDEHAAEIAAVNLMLQALQPKEKLPLILGDHIKVGNSLISGDEKTLKKYFGDNWKEKKPFNWEKEFPEVFQGKNPGFDVIIGNPPYIRTHQLDKKEKRYFDKNFVSSYGQYDILVLFLERAIGLLKNGGRLSFIISSKVASSEYGKAIRKYILQTCAIEIIVDLSTLHVFEDASVYPYILVLKKESDPKEREKNIIKFIEVSEFDEFVKGEYTVIEIPQKVYYENGDYIFDNLPENIRKIINKMEKNKKLGELAYITRGFRPPPEELLFSSVLDKKKYRKLAKGDGLKDRYLYIWDGTYVLYDRKKIKESKDPDLFEQPKIMIRDICLKPSAYYDDEGYFPLKTIYTIHKKEGTPCLKYITAIINSKLSMFYLYHRFWLAHIGGGYLRFRKQYISQLPIPIVGGDKQKNLSSLADRMLSLHREMAEIDVDFENYVNRVGRVKDAFLKEYFEEKDIRVLKDGSGRSSNRIEVGGRNARRRLRGIHVREEGKDLVFSATVEEAGKNGAVSRRKIDVMRVKIADEPLRKFLFYAVKTFARPSRLGRGTLYDVFLKIRVPRFETSNAANLEKIHSLMDKYLAAVHEREKLEREIAETDREIDRIVYSLYGLTEEEIAVVENSFKDGGASIDGS